jgi:hypothetical protein
MQENSPTKYQKRKKTPLIKKSPKKKLEKAKDHPNYQKGWLARGLGFAPGLTACSQGDRL